jgi:hypothetical protein
LGNDSTLSLSTTAASIAGTLAVTGNATFDTTTLVVDATNNRVGINKAVPSATLDVSGTFGVSSSISAASISTTANNTFNNSSGRAFDATSSGVLLASSTAAHDVIFGDNDVRYFSLHTPSGAASMSIRNFSTSTNILTCLQAGNVGIGTSTPSAKLDVNGISVLSGAYHYQGAGTFRKQFIQGSVTAAASGSPVKIFTSGFSTQGIVHVIARQDVSNLATASFGISVSYGGTSPFTAISSSANANVTGISAAYNNTGYVIEITVTYTGAAPTIHFFAEGMSEASWTL